MNKNLNCLPNTEKLQLTVFSFAVFWKSNLPKPIARRKQKLNLSYICLALQETSQFILDHPWIYKSLEGLAIDNPATQILFIWQSQAPLRAFPFFKKTSTQCARAVILRGTGYHILRSFLRNKNYA